MPESQTTQSHQTVTVYLIVPKALEFIAFIEKVFQAKQNHLTMRDETIVAHAELQIGTSVIMLADAIEGHPPRGAGLFVYVPNADETYAAAIAAGAKSVYAPTDMPYGRSCGIIDPYGNDWWPTTNAAISDLLQS